MTTLQGKRKKEREKILNQETRGCKVTVKFVLSAVLEEIDMKKDTS